MKAHTCVFKACVHSSVDCYKNFVEQSPCRIDSYLEIGTEKDLWLRFMRWSLINSSEQLGAVLKEIFEKVRAYRKLIMGSIIQIVKDKILSETNGSGPESRNKSVSN